MFSASLSPGEGREGQEGLITYRLLTGLQGTRRAVTGSYWGLGELRARLWRIKVCYSFPKTEVVLQHWVNPC